jgi:EAL domain-containing protein (putative c-di-GMP-specific phosphodiesterase class I)
MPTSTSAHATRFFLREPARAEHSRYLGLSHPRCRQFGSPAGLHRAPWVARLRRALAEDRFVLHYQPIVSLRDGSVSHHEALVRLDDEPGPRLVSPGAFLPAAERHGLIRDIDRMVLAKVTRLLGEEDRHPAAVIAVNLSAVSITDAGMLAYIAALLAHERVEPERLVIEVTETSAISDMQLARNFCAGVQALGCAVALDDFGAGFGSFQYLKQLPFRYLKIDGDFIRGLPDSPTDQLVVRALAELVAGMGSETIAEFVGDQATLRLLASFGVDHAQGYEVGRPLPELHFAD